MLGSRDEVSYVSLILPRIENRLFLIALRNELLDYSFLYPLLRGFSARDVIRAFIS